MNGAEDFQRLPSLQDDCPDAAVLQACSKGDLAVVSTILQKDARAISARDKQGRNAAHRAAAHLQGAPIVELLYKEDPGLFLEKDSEGCTPANRAAREGMTDTVKFLEKK